MNKITALAGLLFLLSLAACAEPAKPVNQAELARADTQADLTALKSHTQEMNMRLDQIESSLGKGQGVSLEDINRRLSRLEQTVARMAATLGVDTGSQAGAPSPGQAAPPVSTLQPDASGVAGTRSGDFAPSAASPPAGPISMGPSSSDPAEAIYNMAMEAYNQRDLDRANSLFSEMLKSYPAARQSPDALFWQAETNAQQGDYGRAALICQDLIQKYPNHPLVPAAMLKQALCFRKLGKGQAARILLQDVVKHYPGTPEARSAQGQLRDMP
jgi:tol-pal system protein YbgF